jgi:hypothetical protein
MMYQLRAPAAYRAVWEHRAVDLLDRFLGRDPERRARLERAAGEVDRELAANLELSAVFDQTHQAAVFENAQFTRHALALRRDLDAFAYELLAAVYQRVPDVESAMERRGPANSIKPEDRALIETWEGDVREAQRLLRTAPGAPRPSVWSSLVGRLRGGRLTGR